MELVGILIREINQTEKDKYCMISPICKNLNTHTHTRPSYRYKEHIGGARGGG